MRKTFQVIFAFVVALVLLVPQYARASVYDEVVQDLNFKAIGEGDEVQNNLDDGSRTNFDTWDPVPIGVWYGGWPIESRLRLSDVPDTDFVVALATVCRFGSDLIMSGASRSLVRLPVHTPSTGAWSEARMNVYEISAGSNWTFKYHDDLDTKMGYNLDHLRINFTSGNHELVFWSEEYNASDISITDDNDHFTRSNRTYAFVDAPIYPGRFYLFITYVKYLADSYVEIYIQPDSLDSEGVWNRSTIATYNEEAPDTYSLVVNNFNASCGYSFDFRNGFGNNAYGLNIWMESGDYIKFYTYADPNSIDYSNFFTFMLPYRSTLDNISWHVQLGVYKPSTGGFWEIGNWGTNPGEMICNDFVLISMSQSWQTNLTATGAEFTGWLRIVCRVWNDTRLYLPLWDIPSASGSARMNQTWGGSPVSDIWDSDSIPNYNFMQWVQHCPTIGPAYYNYHWMVQHALQWNAYKWVKSAPGLTATVEVGPTANMSLTSKVIYGVGSFFLKVGNWVGPINYNLGIALRSAGLATQVIAMTDTMPDFIGWAWDKIQRIGEFFKGIGQWIWRAVQSAIGAIRWFVETVAYFASVILGLLLVVLAIAIPLTIAWFAMKMGLTLSSVMHGQGRAAADHVSEMVGVVSKLKPKGG